MMHIMVIIAEINSKTLSFCGSLGLQFRSDNADSFFSVLQTRYRSLKIVRIAANLDKPE